MYLDREEIDKYKRALKARKKLFSDDKMAIYVGKKCIGVMQRVAKKYARTGTLSGSLPERIP